jgi:hypothetical protein
MTSDFGVAAGTANLTVIGGRNERLSELDYSIKDLEPLYGFAREVSLADARVNLRVVERALELAAPGATTRRSAREAKGRRRPERTQLQPAVQGHLETYQTLVRKGTTMETAYRRPCCRG